MQQSESAGRAAAGKRASIIGIGCNLGLFGVCLLYTSDAADEL